MVNNNFIFAHNDFCSKSITHRQVNTSIDMKSSPSLINDCDVAKSMFGGNIKLLPRALLIRIYEVNARSSGNNVILIISK